MREQQSRPIGYWAKHLDTLINRAFEQALHDEGVTRRQWQVLSTLSWGGRSVESLHETLDTFQCDQGDSVTAALRALEQRGWLVEHDGILALTPAGEAATEALRQDVDKVRAEMSRGISPEDFRTAVDTLQAMCDNLSPAQSSAQQA
jgi:DNA-binding MarR family transcriptional regulator